MNTYWWLRPSRIALFIALPLHVVAYLEPDSFYRQFGAFNAITGEDFFLAWLSLMCFASGSWLGETLIDRRRPSSVPLIRQSNFSFLFFGLAFLATAGTLVFLAPFALQPALVVNIVTGVPGAAELERLYVDSIPGITSSENLFNLVIVLFMLKPTLTGLPRTRAEKALVGFVVALTAVKVVINSERLALIELLVPLGVLICTQRRRSMAVAMAPLAAISGLFAFFTVTEYLRSWVTYYAAKSDSLLDFAMERMFGYYVTAINNGAFIYNGRHDYIFPVFTGAWLWRLPIPAFPDNMEAIAGGKLPGPSELKDLLYGLNVEFNNTSGVFAPLTDYGPILGVLVWVGLGYISGRLYRKFVDGKLLGLLLFPTWYVGVLEIPRVFYWADNRYFPSLVMSLSIVAYWLLSTQRLHPRMPLRPSASAL